MIAINKELLNKISKITFTEYNKEIDTQSCYCINSEEVESILKDLLIEIDRLNEKYEDLEQNVRDNYKQVTVEEQVGVSDRDFV